MVIYSFYCIAQLFDNTIEHSEYDYLEDHSHDRYITAWYNSVGYDHSDIKPVQDSYTEAVVDEVLANKTPFATSPPIQKSPVNVETLEYSQLANSQFSTVTSTVFSLDDNVHISLANYTTDTLGGGEFTEEMSNDLKYPEISFTTLTYPEDDHFQYTEYDHFQDTDNYVHSSTHRNRDIIYIHSSGSEASSNHPAAIEYDREEMIYWKSQVDESSENLGKVSARLVESFCNKKKHPNNGESTTHRERNHISFNVDNDQDNVLYLFIKLEDQLSGIEIE